jgi:hypothetical protein
MSGPACVDPSSSTITTSGESSCSAVSTADTSISPDGLPKVSLAGNALLKSEELTVFQKPQLPSNGNEQNGAELEDVPKTAEIANYDDGNDSLEPSDDENEVSAGSSVGDAEIDVGADDYSAYRKARIRLLDFYIGGKNVVPLEDRIKKAPKRVRQYRDYIKLMEDRLSSVEERLARFEKPVQKETTEASRQSKERVPAIPELNLVRWGEFKAPSLNEKAVYVIDVLVGDPVINFRKPSRRGTKGTDIGANGELPTVEFFASFGDPTPSSFGGQKSAETAGSSLESATEPKHTVKPAPGPSGGYGQLAERIRINSLPLIRILEKIHDGTIAASDASTVLMFRPYRALMYYEDEIREWLKKLESKFASKL